MALSKEDAQQRLGTPVLSIERTPYGEVATDGQGNRVLFAEGGLYWYGAAPNDGLPLFVPAGPAPGPAVVLDPVVEDGVVDAPDDRTVDHVLDGASIADVVAWVGEDPARACAALDVERAKGEKARSTLVAALEKLAG